MSLTLTKETGAGLSNANTYASVADGDAYHEGHLYASAWANATTESKEAALVMATRLLNAELKFNGVRAIAGQALAWPRRVCPDPDTGDMVPFNSVPVEIVRATCELARELIIVDRTLPPDGEGLKYKNEGTSQTGYDKNDKRPVVPLLVQTMVNRFGSAVESKGGMVKLIRT